MTSKEALRKLFFDNEDLHVDIVLNDIKVYEIYNIIKDDLERLKKIEKQLKQTKFNFKNSQTHSKNRYKKLKNDMDRLINIIKDYYFITDFDIAWVVNCEDEEFLRKILK